MSRTPSTMLPLGQPLPGFSLPDTVSGKSFGSKDLAGKPAVVMFLCNHCPYVKHVRAGLSEFGHWAKDKGVPVLAISSNDVENYPDDSPELMKQEAAQAGYVFPYLYDESQDVDRAFQAASTPYLYFFDAEGKLAYRGQFDDSRPRNDAPVTGRDLRDAVEALLAGRKPSEDQRPSIGCNIKWK
jgi:thiol-disulfide isomerase/thioredoxin